MEAIRSRYDFVNALCTTSWLLRVEVCFPIEVYFEIWILRERNFPHCEVQDFPYLESFPVRTSKSCSKSQWRGLLKTVIDNCFPQIPHHHRERKNPQTAFSLFCFHWKQQHGILVCQILCGSNDEDLYAKAIFLSHWKCSCPCQIKCTVITTTGWSSVE